MLFQQENFIYIPVTGLVAHEVVRRLGSHIFLENRLKDAGEVATLKYKPLFGSQEDSWYFISVTG
jgi:hypothetical protein